MVETKVNVGDAVRVKTLKGCYKRIPGKEGIVRYVVDDGRFVTIEISGQTWTVPIENLERVTKGK
jgi:hypothetical protein